MTEKQGTIMIIDEENTVERLLKQELSNEEYHRQEAGNANEVLGQPQNDIAGLMLLGIVHRSLKQRWLELENQDHQCHLEGKVEAQAKRNRLSFIRVVTALAYALEAKNEYTAAHSLRVATTSAAIARELGMPEDDIDRIRLAGLIHDVGKIGVKESVLNKPSSLTSEEFEHVKRHCEIGQRILSPIVDDEQILLIVRHHHERYDGTGYPDRLFGEQIPLGARILAVADSYDAMTSDRPYRDPMSVETAFAEIERGKGIQFDPRVVNVFLRTRKLVGGVV